MTWVYHNPSLVLASVRGQIPDHAACLFGNDRYDLVQGYMTQVFADWLKGTTGAMDAELSPIDHNFRGLAPLYLQAGGKEILVDMDS